MNNKNLYIIEFSTNKRIYKIIDKKQNLWGPFEEFYVLEDILNSEAYTLRKEFVDGKTFKIVTEEEAILEKLIGG